MYVSYHKQLRLNKSLYFAQCFCLSVHPPSVDANDLCCWSVVKQSIKLKLKHWNAKHCLCRKSL